jgi:hypothetical protein
VTLQVTWAVRRAVVGRSASTVGHAPAAAVWLRAVLRFTGGEVYADASACVTEAIALLEQRRMRAG